MASKHTPKQETSGEVQQQTGVGRLANASAKPGDMSAIPGVLAPIGQPAQEATADDLDEHPPSADGDVDRARIVPPDNQGDSDEVTDKVAGEAGATVY